MSSLNNRYDCGSMAEFWSGTKIIGNHFEVECQWNKTWLPELPECKGWKHLIELSYNNPPLTISVLFPKSRNQMPQPTRASGLVWASRGKRKHDLFLRSVDT